MRIFGNRSVTRRGINKKNIPEKGLSEVKMGRRSLVKDCFLKHLKQCRNVSQFEQFGDVCCMLYVTPTFGIGRIRGNTEQFCSGNHWHLLKNTD